MKIAAAAGPLMLSGQDAAQALIPRPPRMEDTDRVRRCRTMQRIGGLMPSDSQSRHHSDDQGIGPVGQVKVLVRDDEPAALVTETVTVGRWPRLHMPMKSS